MPRNIVPSSTPIRTSVERALRDSGCLKAGTPFEIASVPVIAVQPWAKADIRKNRPSACAAGSRTDSGGVVDELAARAAGTGRSRSGSTSSRRRRRSGAAKIVPGLADAAQVGQRDQDDRADEISTAYGSSSGTSEVIAATPAAIDTETVRT